MGMKHQIQIDVFIHINLNIDIASKSSYVYQEISKAFSNFFGIFNFQIRLNIHAKRQ